MYNLPSPADIQQFIKTDNNRYQLDFVSRDECKDIQSILWMCLELEIVGNRTLSQYLDLSITAWQHRESGRGSEFIRQMRNAMKNRGEYVTL
jgi:hypothetical protein